VVVDVEVGILDPHRMMDAEGHLDQTPAERRQQVEPLLELLLEPLVGVAAGDRRRVEHGHLQGVHVLVPQFISAG